MWKLSPKVINAYLGRSKIAKSNVVPSLDKISGEITSNQVQQCPKRAYFPMEVLV